uniref:AAA_23 domain-containing protein n=2 Tax=Rhabditophanes sp. KR3021 TaxID=114890 RepID=A0AC35TKG8_9BILA
MVQFTGLKIQNIRSIGETPVYINFDDTLTIIQGKNGTGKTTIIEALSYATTGCIPTGKMNSFIHNNTIANKARVDASVQVQFINTQGQSCIVTKRMNSSVKGTKSTTKQDEYTLLIKEKDGTERSISSKVLDFNKEIITHLGVSKALVENVIFCHQEESDWPFNEPRDVKTRLDAIFGVTKYVKAVEHVFKIVKDCHSQIKTIDMEIPYLVSDCMEHSKITAQHTLSLNKLQKLENAVDSVGEKKSNLLVEVNEIKEKRKFIEEQVKTKDLMKNSLALYQKRYDEMNDTIDYHGTIEELHDEIEALASIKSELDMRTQRQCVEEEFKEINDFLIAGNKSMRQTQEHIFKMEVEKMRENDLNAEKDHIVGKLRKEICVPPESNILEYSKKIKLSWEKEYDKCLVDLKKKRDGYKVTLKASELKLSTIDNKLENLKKEVEIKKSVLVKTKKELTHTKKICEDGDKVSTRIERLQSLLDSINVPPTQDDGEDLDKSIHAKRTVVEVLKNWEGQLVTNSATRIDNISNSIVSIQDTIKCFEDEIKDLESIRPGVVTQINSIEVSIDNNEQMFWERERSGVARLKQLEHLISELEAVNQKLTVIGPSYYTDLERLKDELEGWKMNINRLTKQRNLLELEISGYYSKQKDKKLLDDQMKKIKIKNQMAGITQRLTSFKESHADLNEILEAEVNMDCEYKKACEEACLLENEILNTRLQSEEFFLASQNVKYKLAGDKYKEKLVRKIVLKSTIRDLNCYIKVLDDSIVNFHKQKLEQVNEVLGDLWRKVYKGNDIETIRLKSNVNDGLQRNKCYDYSLVMIIDGNEFGMRGRCSAGQKMLASILIRVALSEVFCFDCAVLALDEPTAHLDSSKVETIAEMLVDLINYRCTGLPTEPKDDCCVQECLEYEERVANLPQDLPKGPRNFQLMIITHDENLVSLLYRNFKPDLVYKLKKNVYGISSIRGHTCIEYQ